MVETYEFLLLSTDGEPLEGVFYEVFASSLGDAPVGRGVTDGEGSVRMRLAAATTSVRVVTQKPRLELRLGLGDLHPLVEETPLEGQRAALQARLTAAGFVADAEATLTQALRAFQKHELGHEDAHRRARQRHARPARRVLRGHRMSEITHLPADRRMNYRVWPLVLQQLEVRPHGPEDRLKVEWRAVSGACVALLQVTEGRQAQRPGWGDLQLGRTSDNGSVAAREIGDIESVPSDSSVKPKVHVVPGEGYRLFWTPVKEVFEEFGDLLQTQPERWDATWDEYAPQLYQAAPAHDFEWENDEAGVNKKRLLELDLSHDEQELIFHVAFRPPKKAQRFHVKASGGGYAAYMDVTPPALRAMYAAEILSGHAAREVAKHSKHLSTLLRCQQIAEMTAGCLPDAGIESAQKKATKKGTREFAAHCAFRHFVWKCAALEIDEELVKGCTNGQAQTRGAEWQGLALEVANASMKSTEPGGRAEPMSMRGVKGPIRHPWLRREELGLDQNHMLVANFGELSDPIRAYYYMYRFGFQVLGVTKGDTGADAFHTKIHAVVQRLKDYSGDELRGLQKQLLAAAPHRQFMHELYCCFDPRRDTERMTNLVQRYVDVAAGCGLAWWTDLAQWKPAEWEEFKDVVSWMNGVNGGLGGVLKNLFGHQFKAYDWPLRAANEMLTTFFRYDVAAAGGDTGLKVFEQTVPGKKTTVKVDFYDSTIEVKGSTPKGKTIKPVKFTFLSELIPTNPETMEPIPAADTRARTRALKRAKAAGKFVHYEVEAPIDFDEARKLGHEIPAAISFMGTFLNNAAGVVSVAQKLSKGEGGDVPLEAKVQLAVEVSKNAVELVADARDLADAISPWVEEAIDMPSAPGGSVASAMRPDSLWKAASDAAKLGKDTFGALDAANNIYSGVEILVSEDGSMAFEGRRGEGLRAAAQGVKGGLSIGMGIASAGEMIVANGLTTTFLGVGAVTLGWAVAIGGIAVFTIDTLLDALSDWDKDMEALIKALDEALREELKLEASQIDTSDLTNGASAGSRWACIAADSQASDHIAFVQQVAMLQLTGSGPKSV